MLHHLSRLTFAAAILVTTGCSKEEEAPLDDRPIIRFEGTIVNDDTSDPVSGLEIRYFSELGCSAILKELTTYSANDGAFSFSYKKDIDSLVAEAQRLDVDTSYVNYSISVNEPYFLVLHRTQGSREIVHSRDGNLRPNQEPVSIRLLQAGILELEFEDLEFKYPKSIMELHIYMKDSPSEVFRTFYYYSDGELTDTEGLPDIVATLPAEKTMLVKWTAKEGLDFAFPDDFEVVAEGQDEIRLEFKQHQVFKTLNF